MSDTTNRQTPAKAPKRESYFDVLRLFATFAVIILHTSVQHHFDSDVRSFAWNVCNFYDGIVRWGVPVFIMISGALFLNGEQSVKKLYRKYILRIVTAFLFWSLFYAAVTFAKERSVKSALTSFIGGYYHMWFLFMIVGLYMIVPFLRVIVRKGLTGYFLALSLVFAFLIPQATGILSLFNAEWGAFLQTVVSKMSMQFVLGYTFYFVLGYALHRKELSAAQYRAVLLLGALGFLTPVLASIAAARYFNEPEDMFFGSLTLNVLCETLLVFFAVRRLCERVRLSEKTCRLLSLLSKYSFGAYLAHAFFLGALKSLGLDTYSFTPLLAVPCIGTAVFCLSFAVSALLHRIPLLNKYIV